MSSRDPARPNILFILTDDQGPWALGAAGNQEIKTPQLDRLAERGTRLQNFFCASPVCSPARASLLTGTIPSAHGVHDWLAAGHSGSERVDFLAGKRLFTDALADAGYRLGLSGKWHLGASDRPRAGFVHWCALQGGSSHYRNGTVYRAENGGTVREVEVTEYLTDYFADDAVAFLRGEAGEEVPFFAALTFNAPHSPWGGEHPPEFEEWYRDCAFTTCPQEPWHEWAQAKDGHLIGGEADTRAALIGYFAAISAMDAAVGRVMTELESLGLVDNTIVIFSSDNGFSCGQHGFWGKGNGTFPQNMFENSVRVPMIFHAPGRIPGGRVREDLLSAYDLAATVLELAGLEPSEFEAGPGRSFARILRGDAGAGPERPVVVFDEYGPTRMIRTADWKYVHRHPWGPHELYDLRDDPDERRNRVHDRACAGVLSELRLRLGDWFTQYARPGSDGVALPVSGAGQVSSLAAGGYSAFREPDWDGYSPESMR